VKGTGYTQAGAFFSDKIWYAFSAGARAKGMLNSTTTCQSPDASGTSQCFTIYGQSSSTDPMIVGGFTAGETVLIVELFLLLTVLSVGVYHLIFRRIKIKNQ